MRNSNYWLFAAIRIQASTESPEWRSRSLRLDGPDLKSFCGPTCLMRAVEENYRLAIHGKPGMKEPDER